MTTATGHTTAILASRVKGASVYDVTGEKIGRVEDIILDKQSDRIMFAALGFGGMWGVGRMFYPVPWSLLDYASEKKGYVVPLTKANLEGAPAYDLDDLTKDDGFLGDIGQESYSYYKVEIDG
jgi:sporulation protein YlmC with PRC-barrel domain